MITLVLEKSNCGKSDVKVKITLLLEKCRADIDNLRYMTIASTRREPADRMLQQDFLENGFKIQVTLGVQ